MALRRNPYPIVNAGLAFVMADVLVYDASDSASVCIMFDAIVLCVAVLWRLIRRNDPGFDFWWSVSLIVAVVMAVLSVAGLVLGALLVGTAHLQLSSAVCVFAIVGCLWLSVILEKRAGGNNVVSVLAGFAGVGIAVFYKTLHL